MGITTTDAIQVASKNPLEFGARQHSQITVISGIPSLGTYVANYLARNGGLLEATLVNPHSVDSTTLVSAETVVYIPSLQDRNTVPDLSEAKRILNHYRDSGATLCILVSSAAIYDANIRNSGLVPESHPLPTGIRPIANQWMKLEEIAGTYFKRDHDLTVLRCATILSQESPNSIARLFTRRVAVTLPGHDPSIQLVGPDDLAQAIDCILRKDAHGIFNLAPNEVIPLKSALRQSGKIRIPVPRTLRRTVRRIFTAKAATDLDYACHSWTVSNDKLSQLGFAPRSSAKALAEFLETPTPETTANATGQRYDDFGMDKDYIAFYGRTLFRFLSDWYWRIEVTGTNHIPLQGRGILTGIHRGFMPWDGVMALHLVVRSTGRYPRFLIHPGLLKFPFLSDFMTKLGGIVACQNNAAHVLERDELLGVFPEGIHGAFVRYSQAYKIGDFHRDAFVKIALRHRAPIVPFVTVGSAEIFPILAKIKSRWWTKYSEWPAFPITPTFPLIPLPLPSKWHTRFLPPMHIEEDYPASAATNTRTVRAISNEVRLRMQQAIDEMLQRRRSIFFGSIFSTDTK